MDQATLQQVLIYVIIYEETIWYIIMTCQIWNIIDSQYYLSTLSHRVQ